MAIEEGKAAPAFTLADADGKKVSLKDFAGKHVILYFYPKDDTPGCTKEACGFRDDWKQLQKANAVVLGVSADAPAEAIIHAYRRRARTWHPDVRPHDPEAALRFKMLTDAYHVLTDPVQRAEYDRGQRKDAAPRRSPDPARGSCDPEARGCTSRPPARRRDKKQFEPASK